MTRIPALIAATALTVLAPSATVAGEAVVETREFQETVAIAPGARLVVDNLWGQMTVTGDDGNDVRAVVVETIEADSARELEQAREEVRLEIHQTAEGVVICADGPFRDPRDCTEWAQHSRHERDYRVSYDIELRVPRRIDLRVRTVEGEIDVSGIHGDFRVNGVNGGVGMTGIRGSGRVGTVNGPVRVEFDENPTRDTVFSTVNGEIDVVFRAGLSADLGFETMNGDVLSDFEYHRLPPEPVAIRDRGSRTIYKLDSGHTIRVARGGPKLTFKNINGDILVRRDR